MPITNEDSSFHDSRPVVSLVPEPAQKRNGGEREGENYDGSCTQKFHRDPPSSQPGKRNLMMRLYHRNDSSQ
jgi:hypothetical protein